MVVSTREQISAEVIKISSDMGSAFFLRITYLSLVKDEEIAPGAEFVSEREEDIIDAGLCYAAERKAEEYLARCEQSRFSLTNKLIQKNYEKKHVEKALDFLESKNFLSDYRFSYSWLSSRSINRFEGRTKLLMELKKRGISSENANRALDDFFLEKDEESLARKCLEKILRTSKNLTKEKLSEKMIRSGFSWKIVKKTMDEANLEF